MLKKLMALATTTAMLGANAAAYALNTARAAVRTVTGAPATGNEGKAPQVDGRTIQPSIPPLPPVTPKKERLSVGGTTAKPTGHKANRVKARHSKTVRKKANARPRPR